MTRLSSRSSSIGSARGIATKPMRSCRRLRSSETKVAAIPEYIDQDRGTAGESSDSWSLVAAALTATSIGGSLITGGIATPSPAPVPPSLPAAVASEATDLTWRSVPPMSVGRIGHTATLLRDGRVLVVGGYSASAEIWDPWKGSFAMTGSMAHLRTGHAAALISDGRVLVVGGNSGGNLTGDFTREVEVWDPATGTFSVVGSLPVRRGADVSATRLLDGRVLVAGGVDCPSNLAAPADDPCGGVDLRATVLFDPATNSLDPGPHLNDDRVGGDRSRAARRTSLFPRVRRLPPTSDGRGPRPRVRPCRVRRDHDGKSMMIHGPRCSMMVGSSSQVCGGCPGTTASSELWDPTTGQFTI